MNLRNAHLAIVEHHKITGYLMNSAHPDNGGKAQFFESLGFSIENPESLISALLAVAQTGEVVQSVESAHGEKHVVDGSVSSQTEKSQRRTVRTVWITIEAPKHLAW